MLNYSWVRPVCLWIVCLVVAGWNVQAEAQTAQWYRTISGSWFETSNWSFLNDPYPDYNPGTENLYRVMFDVEGTYPYTATLAGNVTVGNVLMNSSIARLIVKSDIGDPNRGVLDIQGGRLNILNGVVELVRSELYASSIQVAPTGELWVDEYVQFNVPGRIDGTLRVKPNGRLHINLDETQIFGAIELINGGSIFLNENQSLDGTVTISGPDGGIFGPDVILGPGVTVAPGGGGTLRIGALGLNPTRRVINQGALNAVGQNIAAAGEDILNQGTVEIGDGDSFSVRGRWENQGVVNLADGGTFSLHGDIDLTKLGTFNRSGGTVVLGDVLENTGQTIDANTVSGPFTLPQDAGIVGGIVDGVSITVETGASLRGVTFNGAPDTVLTLQSGFSDNPITLEDVTLNIDTQPIGYMDINVSGNIEINQTLGLGYGQTIIGAGALMGAGSIVTGNNFANIQSTGPLTLGQDLTIEVGNGKLTIITNTAEILNQATIRADHTGDAINIIGPKFTNQGLIEVTNGALLEMILPSQGQGPGQISVNDASLVFTTSGAFDPLFSEVSVVNASMEFNGNLTTDQLTSFQFDGANVTIKGQLDNTDRELDLGTLNAQLEQNYLTIQGGRITNSISNQPIQLYGSYEGLTIGARSEIRGATLSGPIVFEHPTTLTNGYLELKNALLDSPTRVNIETNNATITANTGVTIGENISLVNRDRTTRINGTSVRNNGKLTNVSGRIEISSRFVNEGEVYAISGAIIFKNLLDNQGLIDARSGVIQIDTNMRNEGTLRLSTGGRIIIKSGHGPTPLYTLGNIDNQGGRIQFEGRLDRRGGVLDTDLTGEMSISNDAILQNMTIQGDSATPFQIFGGMFENITFDRDVSLSSSIHFSGDTVINGAITAFNYSQFTSSTDNQILGQGSIETSGNGSLKLTTRNDTLTLGPDLTLRNDGRAMELGAEGRTVVVNGPVFATQGVLQFYGDVHLNNIVEASGAGNIILPQSTNYQLLRAVDGGGITIFGDFTTPELGPHELDGGRLVINGSLDNTGHTLTASGVGSAYGIEGNTPLIGGTVQLEEGASVWVGQGENTTENSTIDGVSFEGVLRITGNGGEVDVVNTPQINSDFFIENTDVNLFDSNVAGDLHVHTGEYTPTNTLVEGDIFATNSMVNLRQPGLINDEAAIHLDADQGQSSTLAFGSEAGMILGPDMSIRGGESSIYTPSNHSWINQGTVTADVRRKTMRVWSYGPENFINEGLMTATNEATLWVGYWNSSSRGGFTNSASGVLEATQLGQLILSKSWVNDGTIRADGGILRLIASQGTNNGRIEANNSFVQFVGSSTPNLNGTIDISNSELLVAVPMTTDQLFEFQGANNDILIGDTIDNTDRIFNFAPSNGNTWWMSEHGEILGGTVTHTDDEPIGFRKPTYYSDRFANRYTFNGVHLDANIRMDTFRNYLQITNGITLEPGRTITAGNAAIILIGAQTIGGEGTFLLTDTERPITSLRFAELFFSTGYSPNDVLTFGPDITVINQNNHARIGGYNRYSPSDGHLLNQGTIHAMSPGYTVSLYGRSVTNQGNMIASQGATLEMPDGYTQTAGLTRIDHATLILGQPFDLLGGTLEASGLIDGTVHNTGARVSLGDTTSLLNVTGDYSQDANTTIDLTLGGATPGRHDQLATDGVLTLGGDIHFDLARGFINHVRPTDILNVLTSSQLSGTFANAPSGSRVELPGGDLSFLISYGEGSAFDPNQVILSDAIALGLPDRRTLIWQSEVEGAERSWTAGTPQVQTNWSAQGQSNPDDQAAPTSRDTVVFNDPTQAPGDLTLDGIVEVEGLVIEANDFGVTRRDFATPGAGGPGASRLRLGVEGIEANMLGARSEVAPRNVAIGANIELAWDSVIRRTGTYAATQDQRRLYIEGAISGDFDLEIDNEVPTNANSAIQFNRNNTFRGSLTINGSTLFANPSGFGDDTNKVHTATKRGTDVRMIFPDEAHTYNDFRMGEAGITRFNRNSAGDWNLYGDITADASNQNVHFRSTGSSRIILHSPNQTFGHRARVHMGTELIIAGANDEGEAWENARLIHLNTNATNNNLSSSFLLAGDINLEPNGTSFEADRIVIEDADENGGNGNRAAIMRLGQTNLNGQPSIATFGRWIESREDDYLALQLTADAGSHAVFKHGVVVAGGDFGFEKVGPGTVHLQRGAFANINNVHDYPIGPIYVREGTLDVGSLISTVNTSLTVVDPGATLRGFYALIGDLDLSGALDIGPSNLPDDLRLVPTEDTLSLFGDAIFREQSILEIDIAADEQDFFNVHGTLDLGQSVASLALRVADGFAPQLDSYYPIAKADNITGQFLNWTGDQLPNGLMFMPVIDHNEGSLDYLNLVVVNAIPTPQSLLILALGSIGVMRPHRRARPRRSRKRHSPSRAKTYEQSCVPHFDRAAAKCALRPCFSLFLYRPRQSISQIYHMRLS